MAARTTLASAATTTAAAGHSTSTSPALLRRPKASSISSRSFLDSLTHHQSFSTAVGSTPSSYSSSPYASPTRLDDQHPTFVDLVRPPPVMLQRSLSQSSRKSSVGAAAGSWSGLRSPPTSPQLSSRKSSLGPSPEGVVASSSSPRESGGEVGTTTRTFSLGSLKSNRRSSGDVPLPPIPDESTSVSGTNTPSKQQGLLEDLSWGTKWWPFAVVEPSGGSGTAAAGGAGAVDKGKAKAANQDMDEVIPISESDAEDTSFASAPEADDDTPYSPRLLPSARGTISASTPADSTLTPSATDAKQEGVKAQSRGLLEYFAGKGAVESAKEHHQVEAQADKVEEVGLEADLETLLRVTLADDERFGGATAKPLPPPPSATDDAGNPLSATAPKAASASPPPESTATKASSFLPTSMFSSTPLGDAPSLFSNFSLPNNPFLTSASSSSTATSSKSPSSPSTSARRNSLPPPTSPKFAPRHARQFSSSSSANDDGDDKTKRKNVEGMMDEEDKAAVKVGDEQDYMDMYTLIKEKYECPKLPIVFCHGLFGFDTIGLNIKPLQFSYWIGVKEALEAIGVEVLIGRVPASGSIEERAKVLCEQIEQAFPGREVNLIGHSMGGLDGRFLISRLKPTTFKIRSLTTIATPHRGSSFSNFFLEDFLGSERVPTLQTLLKTVGIPGGGAAFNDLTTTKMERFNQETPDDPNVKYYSYGAEFEPGWSNVFRMSWGVIHEREGPNDGLVSVESAKWGEYKATLQNVNHLDLVGWVGKVRFGWAEWLGNPIKFKPVSFYLALAEELAQEGF